jgi:hypothetical protein
MRGLRFQKQVAAHRAPSCWHTSCMNVCMTSEKSVSVRLLVERSGLRFFTERVLQRWARGEISTGTAVELIQADEAERIWVDY